jgi:hypothetical protein
LQNSTKHRPLFDFIYIGAIILVGRAFYLRLPGKCPVLFILFSLFNF